MVQLNFLSRLSNVARQFRARSSAYRTRHATHSCSTTSAMNAGYATSLSVQDADLIRHAALAEPVCSAGQISGLASGKIESGGRRIAYELQVGFEAESGRSPRHAGIRGWALDTNDFRPVATLSVTSQSGKVTYFAPRDPRNDALVQMGVPQDARSQARNCGFSGYVADAGEKVTLALEVDGQSYVIGTGHPKASQILVGRNSWLFLSGDSNDSPGQFVGNHQASSAWLKDWDAYFEAFSKLREIGSGGQLCFLIAPSKESVFPDYYPLTRGQRTPLDSLMERYSSVPGLFYPISILSRFRELSYDRAETHWTHFGARIVCQEILQRFKTESPSLPLHFSLPVQSGDLGWKAVPPIKTHRANANWPNSSKIIFDNFILHHGRIRVSVNPQAPKQQTCMIFGGSSAEHMERYLTAVFARVVYIYSAGAWDPALMNHERPAFTILQSSERFLTRAPDPIIDSPAVVAAKISSGHLIRKVPRDEVLAEWTDPSVALYKAMG